MAKDPMGTKGMGDWLGLGLMLPIATMIGFAMGYGLDKLFHTDWIRYVMLVLGTVSGFIEMVRELNKGMK